MYDLLIKGGKVIDPAQNLNAVLDNGVKNKKIAALEKNIPRTESTKVIDARGKIVTPGLIDMHGHVYPHVVTWLGIDPDTVGVKAGVTTIVDAGSSGCATFAGLRKFVIEHAQTTIYPFLHVCPTGLCLREEIVCWDDIDPEGTVECVETNRDLIKGIKFRLTGPLVISEEGLEVFRKAKKVAKLTRLPLMVHLGEPVGPDPWDLTARCLPFLEAGDILSHVYTAKPGRCINRDGVPLPELLEARRKGVIFEVARGMENISFAVTKAGLEQGILPDIISTDINVMNYLGPVFNLPTVMSQFMAFGLSLEQVVRMATINPARALKMEGHIGSLKAGMTADISVLQLVEGKCTFADSFGNSVTTQQVLLPVTTMKSGKEIVASPTFKGQAPDPA